MTKGEFEEFLISIGGLVNGYYADRPAITSAGFFDINSGWYPLVKELIEKLIANGWDKKICQVKEKFGGLRFYPQGLTTENWELVREYESKSYEVCEVCGQPGETRRDRNWVTTLCETHK